MAYFALTIIVPLFPYTCMAHNPHLPLPSKMSAYASGLCGSAESFCLHVHMYAPGHKQKKCILKRAFLLKRTGSHFIVDKLSFPDIWCDHACAYTAKASLILPGHTIVHNITVCILYTSILIMLWEYFFPPKVNKSSILSFTFPYWLRIFWVAT